MAIDKALNRAPLGLNGLGMGADEPEFEIEIAIEPFNDADEDEDEDEDAIALPKLPILISPKSPRTSKNKDSYTSK